MSYTDRGLREITQGLVEAKALIARKRSAIQAEMGMLEAELSALGKIASAIDSSIEVMRAEQTQREKVAKEKATT